MSFGPEIALARIATPPSISRAADVLVLGRRGYESAVKGAKMIPVRRWPDGSAAPQPDHNRRSGRGTLCAGHRHNAIAKPFNEATKHVVSREPFEPDWVNTKAVS